MVVNAVGDRAGRGDEAEIYSNSRIGTFSHPLLRTAVLAVVEPPGSRHGA